MAKREKIEFGDFQTPRELAREATDFIKTVFPAPEIIIEPTCGKGSFLRAGINIWGKKAKYWGFDINENYIEHVQKRITNDVEISLNTEDFFSKHWEMFFRQFKSKNILIIGNPPWITNSKLGRLESRNLPKKNNFQQLSGFSAKTGKANFDIAEWILITLIESLRTNTACVAMLCKTMTARKVLQYLWKNNENINDSSLHLIDAKSHFNAAVDACLFVTHLKKRQCEKTAKVYSRLDSKSFISKIGISGNELVANIEVYQQTQNFDGIEYYKWRSGIKHDASKVMELTKDKQGYQNAYGEILNLEDHSIYPLLKSSDIANSRLQPRKYVIVTQKSTGEGTDEIANHSPNTWEYLNKYAQVLDRRKSIIYKKRPRFSVFGVGKYSFSSWKVAISAFYKKIHFSVIGNIAGKPIMLDDTCYFIACDSKKEADFIAKLLNSEASQQFFSALIFFDAKRPIKTEILGRIDLKKVAEYYGLEKEAAPYLSQAQSSLTQQPRFVFEKQKISNNGMKTSPVSPIFESKFRKWESDVLEKHLSKTSFGK